MYSKNFFLTKVVGFRFFIEEKLCTYNMMSRFFSNLIYNPGMSKLPLPTLAMTCIAEVSEKTLSEICVYVSMFIDVFMTVGGKIILSLSQLFSKLAFFY